MDLQQLPEARHQAEEQAQTETEAQREEMISTIQQVIALRFGSEPDQFDEALTCQDPLLRLTMAEKAAVAGPCVHG